MRSLRGRLRRVVVRSVLVVVRKAPRAYCVRRINLTRSLPLLFFQLQSSSPCSCARQAPLPVSGVSFKLPVIFEAAGHLEKGHEAHVARLCMCVPQFVSAFSLTSPFHP